MRDETVPKKVVAADEEVDSMQLSGPERRLITNFRATKDSAREMLIDLSEHYRRTLPAKRIELRLLQPGEPVIRG